LNIFSVAFRDRLVANLRLVVGLMPLLARTPSLPFRTNQATALKPRVYPLGPDQPEAAIGLSERVDFHVGELDAPLAQGPEGSIGRSRKSERNSSSVKICPMISCTVLCAMIYTP
jgi:hypothetical protein